MNKQGPLDIQTAIFEDYLEVWVCSTSNIQKMDFLKLKLRQNLVNFHILGKSSFFLKADDFWKENPQTSHGVAH